MLSADLTSTITPTLLSSARVGWTRHRRLDISGAEDMGGFDPATLGWPASYTSALPQRFPPIRVNDYAGASIGQGGGQDGPSDDFYVQETLTKIVGPASAEVRRRVPLRHQHGREPARRRQPRRTCSSRATSPPCVRTSRTLTTADGGNAFASFLLGYMASTNVQICADLRLAQQLHRRVLPGGLARLEPADPERRHPLGLRGAADRDRRTR